MSETTRADAPECEAEGCSARTPGPRFFFCRAHFARMKELADRGADVDLGALFRDGLERVRCVRKCVHAIAIDEGREVELDADDFDEPEAGP